MVEVTGVVPCDPDDIWRIVGGCSGAGHPWAKTIREEQGQKGASVRIFTVIGKDTVCRDQQTYFSNSDRVLCSRHLEGIRDRDRFDARLTVKPGKAGGSEVTWTATIHAAASRLGAICEGTRVVFAAGIAALREQARGHRPRPEPFRVIMLYLDTQRAAGRLAFEDVELAAQDLWVLIPSTLAASPLHARPDPGPRKPFPTHH